jgi:hypothetical protein
LLPYGRKISNEREDGDVCRKIASRFLAAAAVRASRSAFYFNSQIAPLLFISYDIEKTTAALLKN